MAEMQGFKARVEYEVTDGTQLLYTFPFSYLRKKFIKVDVLHSDNSITSLTYGVDYVVNDLSLTLTNPVKVGEHLIIYRQTTTDKIITWNDGSILLASDMNTEDVQMLHLQEEQQDYIQSHSINTKTDSATKEVLWDALNHRVINVSDPKDPQDAVTKHYMENVQGGFVAANTKILNDAKDTLSATQHTQSKAQANETLSKAWAESEGSPDGKDDSLSTTGKTKSAKGWAEQAKSYAGALNMSFIVNTILPVGIIIEFTNDTDPNEIYQGTTWVKMDAGRVLVSAGTYTEGSDMYTYTLGDKGGEAKHQSTIDEMPKHKHDVAITTAGLIGTINQYKGAERTSVTGIVSLQTQKAETGGHINGYADMCPTYTINASHDHTVTVQSTGDNSGHENRPPYEVVCRWKRTA